MESLFSDAPRYDHEAHKWVPQCPYGDICSGCDDAGECARAWWYDDQGKVIVTVDDRFHGEEPKRCRELVESLVSWDDLHLWQYRLDLLREAIEHEQVTVDRERRAVARAAEVLCEHGYVLPDAEHPSSGLETCPKGCTDA